MQGPHPSEASTSGTTPSQSEGQPQTQSAQSAPAPLNHVSLQPTAPSGPQVPYTYQYNQAGKYVWNTQQHATQPTQYTWSHYRPYQWADVAAPAAYSTSASLTYPQPDVAARPQYPTATAQAVPQTINTSSTTYYTPQPTSSLTSRLASSTASATHYPVQRVAYTHHSPPQEQSTPSAAPSPPITAPPFRKHWDIIIKSFFEEVKLTQALHGFEADMLILNHEWEQSKIPAALARLADNISKLCKDTDNSTGPPGIKETLDQRKLEYVAFAPGVEPRTPTTVTKSISQFLAQSRGRNDTSNQQEFLLSRAEKRRKLEESGLLQKDDTGPIASCARTDAKTQNRDLQMKYDIAKNEDGPLRKTMKTSEITASPVKSSGKYEDSTMKNDDEPTAERYPGLDERLENIETHVAVRYAPSPPRSLLDRLQFLENHLVQLEREYPPWAALHFNQPQRGWPPPPRPTPIIVPSHLTSSNPSHFERRSLLANSFAPEIFKQGIPVPLSGSSPDELQTGSGSATPKTKIKASGRNVKSSLHRAVLEKLEVQKAINDLSSTPEARSPPQ